MYTNDVEWPAHTWATIAETALALGVCEDTLTCWRARFRETGQGLPFSQRGRVVRYHRADIRAHLAEEAIG